MSDACVQGIAGPVVPSWGAEVPRALPQAPAALAAPCAQPLGSGTEVGCRSPGTDAQQVAFRAVRPQAYSLSWRGGWDVVGSSQSGAGGDQGV